MSTYTQLLYQIVFSTKNRVPNLVEENRETLYKYIWGILKNKQCHLYQIGGVADHVHIISHLHQSCSISSMVKDIKLATTSYIKEKQLFPNFDGWQEGYGAFSYSISEKDRLIEYVKNQESHHLIKSFNQELIDLLNEHQIIYDERYLH
ncbi:MAG: transposase [Bacteroidota bacterium]